MDKDEEAKNTNKILDDGSFYNLYNQLIDEIRTFTPFEKMLDDKYVCNI